MDTVLPILRSFPPGDVASLSLQQYAHRIQAQIKAIKELPDKTLLLAHTEADSILNILDPGVNTVAFALALHANITNPAVAPTITTGSFIWNQLVSFLQRFDPIQARYLGHEFREIVESTAAIAQRSQQTALAIIPIRDALLGIDPSGTTFTSLHLILARLALESRQYASAIPALDSPKLYFPGMFTHPLPEPLCTRDLPSNRFLTIEGGFSQQVGYLDVLQYYIFAGTIYIGARNWEKAAEALEVAVTYPLKQQAVSKVMVEAYKKWVLVNLLLNGRGPALPKTTSGHAIKAYRSLAKPYDALASLFTTAKASRLLEEVRVGETVWNGDCNAGLVAEVLAAYQKFQIRKLADIYSSISIAEITDLTESAETGKSLLSDDETESLVLSMLNEGSLSAEVTRPPGSSSAVLTFNFASALSEAEVQRQLAASLQKVALLTAEIKDTERRLMFTPEYAKWAAAQKKSGKDGSDDNYLGGPLDALEDEDLMSGMM